MKLLAMIDVGHCCLIYSVRLRTGHQHPYNARGRICRRANTPSAPATPCKCLFGSIRTYPSPSRSDQTAEFPRRWSRIWLLRAKRHAALHRYRNRPVRYIRSPQVNMIVTHLSVPLARRFASSARLQNRRHPYRQSMTLLDVRLTLVDWLEYAARQSRQDHSPRGRRTQRCRFIFIICSTRESPT